jgi:DNA-binding MarR family transcriptional regulator
MSHLAEWYLEKSGDLLRGIGAQTNSKIQEFIEGTDGLEGLDISFLQIGYGFAPDPITPEGYIARGPYGNPGSYKEQMDASVERGWLENAGEGRYTLSKKGVGVVEGFFELGNALFSAIDALSDEENTRIADLLAKLAITAYEQPKPAEKPSLEIGRRLEPGSDAAHMLRIRRYLTDIAYYREDAHIASWQSYGVDGRVWETLTLIWRDEAASAAEIAEQLSQYRNYEEADYAAALDELAARGWVARENGRFVITENGKKIRQESEDTTDRMYAAPFEALGEADSTELKTLLVKLAEVIPPPEDEETE